MHPLYRLSGLLLLAPLIAPMPALGTIFKCRDPSGHWSYSAHRPHNCRSAVIILKTTPLHKSAPETPPRNPGAPRPLPAAVLKTRLKEWRRIVKNLEATSIPRNPQQDLLRRKALRRAKKKVRTLQQALLFKNRP